MSDDPELARLYAPVTPGNPPRVDDEFRYTLRDFTGASLDSSQVQALLQGVGWLLGGAIPQKVLLAMRAQPAALNSLCSNMAARELYGDDAFWTDYRRRVMNRIGPDDAFWASYLLDPKRQVRLVFVPGH